MKKIFRNVLATVAIASVASCAEKPFNEVETAPNGSQTGSNNLTQMTFTASMEEDVLSKTTFAPATGKVSWEPTTTDSKGNITKIETITVFSGAAEGQKFTLANIAKDGAASFTGLADLSADSFYAVYPHSTANTCADGKLTVNIPSEQNAVVDNFASGQNVSVATWKKADLESEEDVIFKNVSTLISFAFANDVDAALTSSITIKVKKNATEYWGIAGNVEVSYTAGGDLEVSEGTEQEVTLNAPASAGFYCGRTYYVSVCPVGEIAGIEITYNYTDGKTTRTKTNNTPDTFTRSSLFALGTLPEAYGDLDLLEIDVDFSNGMPFNEFVKATADQAADTGDTYTLKGSNIPIVIAAKSTKSGGDKASYSYNNETDKYLKMTAIPSTTNVYGYITIPYVQDRYLCAIVASIKSYSGAKWSRPQVCEKTNTWSFTRLQMNSAVPNSTWNDRYNFVCPIGGNDIPIGGTENAPTFVISFRDASAGIKFIKFIYSKTKPTAPAN